MSPPRGRVEFVTMPPADSEIPQSFRPSEDSRLIRGIGLWHATSLNMIDMIGVGPFVTIPLIIAAMHGPQAMLGWLDRKSTRLNSSHVRISYAVFCLKK